MADPCLVGILVFVIPAFILIVPGSAEVSICILAVLGIVKTIKERRNPLADLGNRFLTVICWAFLLVAIISVMTSEPSIVGFQRLGTSIHFLLAPLIGILFLTTPNILKRLVHGIKAGAILAGINAVIEYWLLSQGRADGAVNAIIFGDLALLLGFLAMVNFFKETPQEKFLSALALALGLTAALLSETRNTWGAAPILILTLLFIWWKGGFISPRRLTATLTIALLAAIIFASTPVFQHRYSQMINELKTLENHSEITSVRERVVMWKAGLKTHLG